MNLDPRRSVVRLLFSVCARPSETARPAASWALRVLRRTAPVLGDPMVDLELDGLTLQVPLSHDLAAIRQRLPEYASAIGRLAAAVQADDPQAALIDIGANIGDTVAIVRKQASMPVLCIEASDAYFALLERNVGRLADVELMKALVAGEEPLVAGLEHGRGTARATRDGAAATQQGVPLGELLRRSPRFAAHARLLKIDTDGMDGIILRGSARWLRERLPVLFFEYDPSLWARVGDGARDIFPFLAGIGYGGLMFYDNEGGFMMTADVADGATLDDLHYFIADGARRRYYDVCAFARRDRGLYEAFLAGERARLRGRPAR